MKSFKCIIVCFLVIFSLFSCSDEDNSDLVGNWIRRSDFGGPVRSDASCFVIGNRVYIFGGSEKKDKRLNDIWEYNPDQGYWTQKADFPGAARSSAFSFASEDKGYIGTGYDGISYYKDFWEFDPIDNKWTQKSDFPGVARSGATAFFLNGVGYAGTGFNSNYYMDFYKYNPSTDIWETGVSIQGTKRAYATSFVIDNKAYVVGGINNGSFPADFWMFNPETQTWEEREHITNRTNYDFDDDYTTIARLNTVSFVIDGFAYLATGESGGLNSYTWEYDPLSDRWTERTSFEGTARTAAVGFSVNNKGYVLTGRGSTTTTSLYFDDMWEFKPHDEYNEYD